MVEEKIARKRRQKRYGKGTYVPKHPPDRSVDFNARGRIRDYRRGVEQSHCARGHLSATAHFCRRRGQLITGDYVEKVNVDKVMNGAMHGLADSLDPDSAYLSADQVKQIESNTPLPAGDVGFDLTRQYYLRVIATRDGSPADKAGLRTGDYVRIIGDMPTREMSVFEGMRRLRGAPGTKVTLTIIRGSASRPSRHRAHARRRRRPLMSPAKSPRPASATCASLRLVRRTADQAKARDCRSREGRRVEAHCRRPPHVGRLARRWTRAGPTVRSERHAGDPRKHAVPTRKRSRPPTVTAASTFRRRC